MEYIYKIKEFKDWFSGLIRRNECGVVVGLPGSGVSRIMGEAVQKLKLPVSFLRALDCRLYLKDGKFVESEIDRCISEWIEDEVKYIVVQFIERCDYDEEKNLIKLLDKIRQRFYRRVNFLVHIKSDYYFKFFEDVKSVTDDIWDKGYFVPFARKGEEFDDLVGQNEKRFQVKLNKRQVDELYDLCGGSPMLAKVLFQKFLDKGKFEIDDEVKEIGKIMIEDFRLNIIDDLKKGKIKKDEKRFEFYKKLGLIDEKGEFVSEVLEKSLEKYNYELVPTFKNEKIFVEDDDISESFSPVEIGVLKKLLTEKRIDRDGIAELFYGKDRMEDVSEYSIDKLMSNIRIKLSEFGVKKDFICTLKGYGYST